jgi:hypothetical protein
VSKAARSRQQARARIARMRAAEARRRRRRIWTAAIGGAAVVIVAVVSIVLAVGGGGPAAGGSPQLKLASLSTLGQLRPAPGPGAAGPEGGVPVPAAAPLAGTGSAASGQRVDGIGCQISEQTVLHIHAHLTIFVHGSARQVPAGVGIPGAQAQSTPQGPLVAAGSCFYWLHTHAADGIIHVESPVHRTFTLGDFFDVWGQSLGPDRVGPAAGPVVAIYNGQRYEADPRDIPLNAHAQIQLEIGRPLIAPERISFPSGL